MGNVDAEKIEKFLHGQVACWNAGDRDGFFDWYRTVATSNLHIEYVGQHEGDGWQILEGMWEKNQANIDIEEVAMIHNGDEVACHNKNKIKGTDMAIDTIEVYRFGPDGDVTVRYFVKSPG